MADDDQSAALRFEESLDVRQDIGDRRGICESWEGVAAARHREGKDDQAADLLGRARDLRQEIGAPVPPIDQTWHQAEFKKIALSPG